MMHPTPAEQAQGMLDMHLRVVDAAHQEARQEYESRFKQIYKYDIGAAKKSEQARHEAHEAANLAYAAKYYQAIKIHLGNEIAILTKAGD
jgi:hypothetical protein